MMMVRISLAVTLLAIAALLHWLAKDRPDRFFLEPLGRPLDDGDRRRAKNFRLVNVLVTIAGVAIVLSFDHPGAVLTAFLGTTLVPAAYLMIALSKTLAGARVTDHPSRFLVPLGGRPKLRDLISVPLQITNLAIIAAGTAAFAALTPYFPERFAVHWDARGKPNGFTDGTELWIPIGITVFDTLLFLFLCWATSSERWVLPEKNGDRYAELQRERRRLNVRLMERMMIAMNASVIAIMLVLAIGGIMGSESVGLAGALVVGPLSTIVLLVLIAGVVPRLTEIGDELRALAATSSLGSHPDGWRWNGMIYYAPNDPAVFVPKRSGLGQTINFARPSAWIFLGAVLVLPVFGALAVVLMRT